MRILTEGYLNTEKSFAATIGFFDGVHKGHQYLISKLQALAKSMGMESMVISFREHPRLDVRHWHGPSPQRVVLTRQRPLSQLIADLYQQGVQSLIVEGGRQTLMSFLDAGLWDEIRVETAPVTVTGGTLAPQLPSIAKVYDKVVVADHIVWYYKR